MLKRFLTMLCLIPLVVAIVLYAHPLVFLMLMLVFVAGAGLEWATLTRIRKSYLFLLIPTAVACYLLPAHALFSVTALALFLWSTMYYWVLNYPRKQLPKQRPVLLSVWGLFVLALPAAILVRIHDESPALVMHLFVLIWLADIGAYLVGKFFGKHRLIPNVSPGKTIEGAMGGFTLAMLYAFGINSYFDILPQSLWLGLCALAIITSILGDLHESMLKRGYGVKDSGGVLPGHGGILDRIDSLTSATPWYFICLMLAEKIIG